VGDGLDAGQEHLVWMRCCSAVLIASPDSTTTTRH
jgi:hypothetical protein